MAGNAADQGRTVTAKLAAILTSFTAGSVQQLTELARHSGLPVSTTHRRAGDGLEVAYIEKLPGHAPVTDFCPAARRPAHVAQCPGAAPPIVRRGGA